MYSPWIHCCCDDVRAGSGPKPGGSTRIPAQTIGTLNHLFGPTNFVLFWSNALLYSRKKAAFPGVKGEIPPRYQHVGSVRAANAPIRIVNVALYISSA